MPDLILTKQLSEYVTGLYKQFQHPNLLYHNLAHTQNVVMRTHEIADNYNFTEKEIFILSSAAWFHDTGHLFGEAEHHEAISISIMKDYFEKKEIEKIIIDSIEGCILATKMPHNPKTLLEEIICDADTFNLGTKDFINTDNLLKKEWELRNNIQSGNWDNETLKLLEKHTYFTPYCKTLLNKGKQENMKRVHSCLAIS